MLFTNKKALEAAVFIKRYCEQNKETCEGCAFWRKGECVLGCEAMPKEWGWINSPRWTKTDKALAEALKLAGVKSMTRSGGNLNTLIFSNGTFSLNDAYDIIQAFKDLKPGERISLDDIISSKGERADE